MMYRGNGIEARIVSFGIGGGVLFTLAPLIATFVPEGWRLFCLLASAYGVAAAAVAYIWPQLGWRTGLWFFLSHPFVLLGSFLLGPGTPINWRTELSGLVGYSLGLVGACLGGWIGSAFRRRYSTHDSPNKRIRPASLHTD